MRLTGYRGRMEQRRSDLPLYLGALAALAITGGIIYAAVDAAIVGQLGKTLKPHAIHFVRDLPRTRNGKILRRLVRKTYLGEPLGDTSALENPAALDEIAAAQ